MIFIYYQKYQLSSYDGEVAVTLIARAFGGKCNYHLHLNEDVLLTIYAEWQAGKAKALTDLVAERDALKDALAKLKPDEPMARLDSDSADSLAEETL